MENATRVPESDESAAATGARNAADGHAVSAAEEHDLERAVDYVLADCFFAVGQTIGMRMTVEHEAVIWWHDHFRSKFLAALRRGNSWRQARESVTAVGWMLAERAVRHAAGCDSIDMEAARQAAADVERYCQHRARRAARTSDHGPSAETRMAGYWCVPIPC